MPCDRSLRCASHSSIPYSSRPSSRICTSQSPRPSSRNNAQSQRNQYNLCGLPRPYPTIPAGNVFTPPHIPINGQPLSHSAPHQPFVGPPSSSVDNDYLGPQVSSSPPCPSFTFTSPAPSCRHGPSTPNGMFGEIPVTDVVGHMLPSVHHYISPRPLLANESPQPPDHRQDHRSSDESCRTNTSPSPDATQLPHSSVSLPPQSSLLYPAPSQLVNYDHSTSMQRHQSDNAYHAAPRHPHFEQVSHSRSQSMQSSFMLQQMPHPSDQRLQCAQNHGQGMFYQASNFSLPGAVFIDYNAPNLNFSMPENNFMSSFLKETIIGAEFDSSDPNMPLRCHRGTRLKIIKRCQDFALSCRGSQKLRWVVGAAGVGKSAIMQSVARESSNLPDVVVGATVFFSINGRQDAAKAVNTIAYQLAAKFAPYRLFVQREIARDPSLFRRSLPTQFNKFIIEPFIYHPFLPPSSRLLVILDGLDECSNISTQQELIGLISFFSIRYPSSPIVWFVASRPEPHIRTFFFRTQVVGSYEEEEIRVDSNDASEDVKLYLRDKFREVQLSSAALRHLSQWPSDGDFFKITNASGGLFAYASAVVRYINNPTYGDPASQLDDVLKLISGVTNSNVSGEDHPMAQLDALYSHIMSKIPAKAMVNTKKLLLVYAGGSVLEKLPLRLICNLLQMTGNAAYGATHHIHAVAVVPEHAQAAAKPLQFFHKSFRDYIQDFERSGFFPDIHSEAAQLGDRLALNIFRQAPDGVHDDRGRKGDLVVGQSGSMFKNLPGTQDTISLSWSSASEDDDYTIRFNMFDVAISLLQDGLRRRVQEFRSLLCMHVLTTCVEKVPVLFPVYAVRDFPFQEPWRSEFLEHGILKQVPLQTIPFHATTASRYIRLRVRGPLANTWNESCLHRRKGHSQDWSTKFEANSLFPTSPCSYCSRRFNDHIEMLSPDYLVTVLELTSEYPMVELRFMDPGDGVSEWIYNFCFGCSDPGLTDDLLSDGEYQSDGGI